MAEGVQKTKKVKAFWWLLGITVAYFAIYYLLIIETEACKAADGFTIQDHWFHGFWDRYLSCRQVNELGDALAGAFAPVAFLWLAGAVLIQSKELEAQRQELNETQEVMREQLAVSREQVQETRASTELLREQADAIKEERQRAKQKEADEQFEAMKSLFAVKFVNRGHSPLIITETGNDFAFFEGRFGAFNSSANFDECFSELLQQIRSIQSEVGRRLVDLECRCDLINVQITFEELKMLVEVIPQLSQASKTNAGRYAFAEVSSGLARIIRWHSI